MTIVTDLEAYMKKHIERAHKIPRQAFLEVGIDVIRNTPVDEGFAKGSWTFSQNSTNPVFSTEQDESGREAIGKFSRGVNASRNGDNLYLLSNLVYMPRLEYGYSTQAPTGMVRNAINRFGDKLKRRLNED